MPVFAPLGTRMPIICSFPGGRCRFSGGRREGDAVFRALSGPRGFVLKSVPGPGFMVRMAHLNPQTLTAAEQEALLQTSACQPRDHLILSFAFGTGLRLGEIVGLDVGDVYFPDGSPRLRVRIRTDIAKGGRAGDVFLPDALVAKLHRFWLWKAGQFEGRGPGSPLFCNQSGSRISKRRVQVAYHDWQRKAGFDRSYSFHCTRHTAVTAVYRASKDLFLTQRFARHASPLTTTVYTHASDDELRAGIRDLVC